MNRKKQSILYFLSHYVCSAILNLVRIFAIFFEVTFFVTNPSSILLPKPWLALAPISQFWPAFTWVHVISSTSSVNIRGITWIQTWGLTKISPMYFLNKNQILDIIIFLFLTGRITHIHSHNLPTIRQSSLQNQCLNIIIKLNQNIWQLICDNVKLI